MRRVGLACAQVGAGEGSPTRGDKSEAGILPDSIVSKHMITQIFELLTCHHRENWAAARAGRIHQIHRA